MDKNKICEAMYALPGDVVVKRRKSIVVPVVLLLVGAALIVVNNLYGAELGNNLRSSLVFGGGVLAVAGLILVMVRLFSSSGVPFHREDRHFLLCDELYFEKAKRGQVMDCIGCGAVDPLLALPRSQVPAVAVVLYRTRDNRFAAMQAYEYLDLEYKPLSELKIVGL